MRSAVKTVSRRFAKLGEHDQYHILSGLRTATGISVTQLLPVAEFEELLKSLDVEGLDAISYLVDQCIPNVIRKVTN
ncbi:MAG: hypothetical protein U0930_04710 [Pirellulales bacterium]